MKELIFSLFSSLPLPSSGNEKGIERAAKTDIASFLASPHFLHSPLVFALLFSLFFDLEKEKEKGDWKREFISSYFHFSFLLENRSRQLHILLPSILFFFSRREWKWDRRKVVFLLLFLLIFFFRNRGRRWKGGGFFIFSFLPESGREEKEEKLDFLGQYPTADFLKYPHFSSSVSPRFSC